jgi:hypothetical protein
MINTATSIRAKAFLDAYLNMITTPSYARDNSINISILKTSGRNFGEFKTVNEKMWY